MKLTDSEIRIIKFMHIRGESISYIREFTRRGYKTVKEVIDMDWPPKEEKVIRAAYNLSERYYYNPHSDLKLMEYVKNIQEV